MSGLFQNITNVTKSQVLDLANSTGYLEFTVKVNHVVWDGWAYFVVLFVFWVIMLMGMEDFEKKFFINVFYASSICAVLSLILRSAYVLVYGVRLGLLTDYQMWIFPVLTLVFGWLVWVTKQDQQ